MPEPFRYGTYESQGQVLSAILTAHHRSGLELTRHNRRYAAAFDSCGGFGRRSDDIRLWRDVARSQRFTC